MRAEASAAASATAAAALAVLRARGKPPDEEANTFGLPEGKPIRRKLLSFFRKQKREVLGTVPTIGAPLPPHFPALTDWDAPMAHAMTPVIGAYWSESGKRTRARLGLDPAAWEVTNPHLDKMIRQASFSFCEATNRTTSLELNDALERLRREIHEGAVEKGESVKQLTKRVKRVFDQAEDYRARRIAITEASRAVHAAQEQSAIESGVVAGLKWLLSSDACPYCQQIASEVGQVRLGQAFAVRGNHPEYATVKHPPAHPNCRCSVTQVLLHEYGGPEEPKWGTTLDQPKPIAPAPPPPPPDPEAELKAALAKIQAEEYPSVPARAAIAKWLQAHATPAGMVEARGMSHPEAMQQFRFGGLDWKFPAGEHGPASAVTQTLYSFQKAEIHPELARHTNEVVFTGQKNDRDEFFAKQYNWPGFTAKATGGNGTIVIYNGKAQDADVITHEMGHSLAQARYASLTPYDRGDFAKARGSAELPPTHYAKVSPSEDFAESVMLHASGKLKEKAPERFKVITRMLEDPSYGG